MCWCQWPGLKTASPDGGANVCLDDGVTVNEVILEQEGSRVNSQHSGFDYRWLVVMVTISLSMMPSMARKKINKIVLPRQLSTN